MTAPEIMLSANFSAADLLEAGETWRETQVANAPIEPETWEALKQLCEKILEPVQPHFAADTDARWSSPEWPAEDIAALRRIIKSVLVIFDEARPGTLSAP